VLLRGGSGDQINLIALSDTAKELIEAGHGSMLLAFRDGDDVVHQLTPAQVLEMSRKGKAAASAIYSASWALKDAAVIPLDFSDDKHWPS
jgi:hypothetical protein